MKTLQKHYLILLALLALAHNLFAQPPPTLGNYPDTTAVVSANTTVIPDSAANGATSINVAAESAFKGVLVAQPTTGAVRITNPHPAGTYVVTVEAFNSGGTTSRTFTLTVASGTACNGTVQFTEGADVGTGTEPVSVAIGDFNNDGTQDFASANASADAVAIRLGDGLGGFSGTSIVSVGDSPRIAVIGDFNNDGNQDFATGNFNAHTVSIRLGDGLGGFSGTTEVSIGGAAVSVAIGDFNNDGKQDFAATNGADPGTVSIRLGDGLGGFSGTTEVSVGAGSVSVAIGDFNHDGNQDFASANGPANTVSIRLGDGLGGFSGTTEVSVDSGPRGLAIGDFNNDGKQDFACANQVAFTVSIRLGDGLGGFSGTTNVSVGDTPIAVATGDFDNDGNQDFATANFNDDTVSIGLGDGSGGFGNATGLSVGEGPRSVAIGDFNKDGTQDFAAGNFFTSNVSIRLGGCAAIPTPTPAASPTPSASPIPDPTPTPSPTATAGGTPSPTPTPMATATPTPTPPAAAQVINLSTRMRVQTGNNVGVGGFIITGTAPKHVLIRAIGPSLAKSGVPDALADPALELHGPDTFVTITNDNWRDDPVQEALIAATGIPPASDLESAIEARLSPGAYTAIVRGKGDTSGVGLVEVYDLDREAASKLANLSTRAFVGTGDNIVIAGFVLTGGGVNNRIIVRGIGPSLAAMGVPGALANPTLELRDVNGALLVANNDWQDDPTQAAELAAAGLAPTNQLESGIARMLPPGLYTALLGGLNNSSGLGLVEVYNTAAAAGNQIPFNGTVSGQIPADLGPPVPGSDGCVFNFFVSNSGNGNQLGTFTGTSNFIPNVCNGSYTGSFRWVAANGDSISGPFFGQLIPTATPGVFDNNETAIVTGGTGRFAGATGMFTLSGEVNFTTLSFVLPFQGTISTP